MINGVQVYQLREHSKFPCSHTVHKNLIRAQLLACFRWTGDKILQEWFFCNTFRVLDKGCQFLIKEVIEKGPQDAQEIVFRVILFNLFTRIETWQLLDKALGPLTWATYDQEKYIEVLQDAFRRQIPLYTPGFIKPAPKWEPRPNYVNHLLFLESLMSTEVDTRLPVASYMADAFEYFFSMESLGPFSAYQLLLNLSYSKVLNFHPNDFVMSGPGSLSGLRKIFGKSWKSSNKEYGFHESVMRYMVDSQAFHFRRLGLEFSGLGPKKLPMDIADIEHTLCEVDKYCRIKHPEIKSGRTNVTRRFNAAPNTPAVNPAVLPKAWSHRARRTPKIRPTPVSPDKDKRYLIDFIRDHKVEDGETFYRVHWLGYPDRDDTWEAEDILMHDAPAAVQYYLDEIN